MSQTVTLDGMRFDPFTNIQGETFANPTLNGYWRIDMQLVARTAQEKLALSSFITQMSPGSARCIVPVCGVARPNDANGRPLTGCLMAPEYTYDHVGFRGEVFRGYTLEAAASHRDSYIDVVKPALSALWPGHYISLGDRLHQVVNVTHLDESETRVRLSVMPSIRGNHAAGETVIVDSTRLACRLESGDQFAVGGSKFKTVSLSFVEAFG
ncbi:hypothetical protein D2T31_12140 [Sinirhodobacter populi]|uniref:Uncharacterized protein n=1 Tax=Paenirhodobacter populi TaxID=2306993 RepID=A0A443K7X3_9RHOB|nr:hypothetical protein [Sinirhodobacter populi]RWR28855.1 hypothetical protein D2T31_12140 [Sinirhodobacter populi]